MLKNNKVLRVFFLLIVSILLLNLLGSFVCARDVIISNSMDWRDVYSSVLYGSLEGMERQFLVSQKHTKLLMDSEDYGFGDSILLVSSDQTPFALGYANTLESKQADVEEILSSEINLDLGRRIIQNNIANIDNESNRKNITNFIVIDDSYGYNAISVAPYAALTKSYVLFVDEDNIDEVVGILEDFGDEVDVLIFGHVDREVKEGLTQFDAEILDEEDRFLNNIEISERFLKSKENVTNRTRSQIIISNGEFIENGLFNGIYPILFLGKTNVPEVLHEFIKRNHIQVAVLVGNQYVGSASTLREMLGISVFVKFGRSARQPSGPMAQVEGLDLFYMPIYDVELVIDSFVYNEATKKVEVTIRNTKDLLAYFKGSYTLVFGDNMDQRLVVGDFDPIFIDANDVKTMTYDAELFGDNISAEAFVVYGESPNSLEYTIQENFQVKKVQIYDNSEIELLSLLYNIKKGVFYVETANVGDVDVFVDLELVDVKIAGTKYTLSSDEITEIGAGKSKKIQIKSDPKLLEEDIEDNSKVKVMANYGERENNLVKRLTAEFELAIQTVDMFFWILVIIILLLFFLIFFTRRKKKKEEEHHHGHH